MQENPISTQAWPTAAELPAIRCKFPLFAERHPIQLIQQATPVVSEHFGVLDSLLCPVLIPPRNMILGVLEVDELVTDTLLDKHGAVVLIDNGFLVLLDISALKKMFRIELRQFVP